MKSETKKILGKMETLPLIALRGLVLFPDTTLRFEVGREKSVAALEHAMKSDRKVFLVCQKEVATDEPSIDELYTVGVTAKVKHVYKIPQTSHVRVTVEGVERAKLINIHKAGEHEHAEILHYEFDVKKSDSDYETALMRRAKELLDEYSENAPQLSPDILLTVLDESNMGHISDFIAYNISFEYEQRQEVLESFDPIKRLEFVCVLLQQETQLMEIEAEIQQKVKDQIDKNQREYYLREQMRVLSIELDEEEDPRKESEIYTEKIKALALKEEHEEKLLKDADRLFKLPPGAQEGGVLRNYLDTVLSLPWNKQSKDNLSIERAKTVLDADHYGLDDIKERMLEMIAVRQLSSDLSAQIICLVGPPGVGKTSIARSVAQAMGRQYIRISLGGVRDEADIRGHRKTYIGAMPGRIVNALRTAKTNNPLILLDEVDKLGADYRGDPSSALLEVLDPAQNENFTDHFIEIPFDLSNVLFLTTANDRNNIPAPLLDRMEVIELSSYTRVEKHEIARRHLIPKQLKVHGLTGNNLRFTQSGIYALIDYYTREAGVRRLEQMIAKACRKVALMLVDGTGKRFITTDKNVEEILGAKRFKSEDKAEADAVGVATGLAWTQVGGVTMPIEVALMDGKGELKLTGSLGDVMKESATAAVSYIRSNTDKLDIPKDFYKKTDIHIHVPEGAVPKDGPSAGIAIATAIVSALTNTPVHGDVAMTGEVTLRGRVLPIGGLKEKAMAAYQYGAKKVLIPEENEPDLEEVDDVIKNTVEFVPVREFSTVLEHALVRKATGKKPVIIKEKSVPCPHITQ